MASVSEHYEQLLAEHYAWMCGGFEEKLAEQFALLQGLGFSGPGRAIDLGCGPGFQSLALANLGFDVLAIDTSERLLAELADHQGSLPITRVYADMRDLPQLAAPAAELIVCMGDTLPHLESREDVTRLFADIHATLAPNGHFVLSFRDLSRPLEGTDRFIPVRSTPDKIWTCFLEYEPDTVLVHDLCHLRDASGWRLEKSCYRKLRLSQTWVAEQLAQAGLRVEHQEMQRGFWTLVTRRD